MVCRRSGVLCRSARARRGESFHLFQLVLPRQRFSADHMLIGIAALAVVSPDSGPKPPPLPTNFYTGVFHSDTKVAGPTYDVQDGVCCPVDDLAEFKVCSASTQQHGSDTYEQGTKQRTRSDGPWSRTKPPWCLRGRSKH